MKTTLLAVLAGVSLAATAQAQLTFTANLSGTNEVPPNSSVFVGTGTFTLTGNTLEYSVGMLAPFFFPASAGIYGPASAGQTGPLVFDLGNYGIAAPLDGFPGALGYIGTLTLTSRQASELLAGRVYVNFTSSTYPDGEIRGQILLAESVADLCPCNAPWKNHGEYVKCVQTAAKVLAQEGLIGEGERKAIVKEAAQSDCGKHHHK
jgi:hypothetical protein